MICTVAICRMLYNTYSTTIKNKKMLYNIPMACKNSHLSYLFDIICLHPDFCHRQLTIVLKAEQKCTITFENKAYFHPDPLAVTSTCSTKLIQTWDKTTSIHIFIWFFFSMKQGRSYWEPSSVPHFCFILKDHKKGVKQVTATHRTYSDASSSNLFSYPVTSLVLLNEGAR